MNGPFQLLIQRHQLAEEHIEYAKGLLDEIETEIKKELA